MAEFLEVEVACEPLRLLADRAVYWPARRRLLVADLHLGKGDVFRNAGIPVPTGGTSHDLARLGNLLRVTRADSLWILGDFLHGAAHPAVLEAWDVFRRSQAELSVALVRGNHDRSLDPTRSGLDELADGVRDGPFEFRHAPTSRTAGGHLLCGHVHPVARLPGVGRAPIFWLRDQALVLPAFSRFTGGYRVDLASCSGSVVCNGTDLVRLP